MKKFLRRILTRPVLWLANKYTSQPDKDRVQKALTDLYTNILANPDKKGPIVQFDSSQNFIILSDQHKGAKNGSDDFAVAEKNYLAALDYYYQKNFYYITLGDSEELWENSWASVKKHNTASFEKEKLFRDKNLFIKIFGNHDLYWDNDPLASFELEKLYGQKTRIYEGAVLQTKINEKVIQILLTHGHQGDAVSDGNVLSKWFIANVWAPLQSFLLLNPNTPAYDHNLKTEHNRMMYEWSAQQPQTLLITGHTHQPIFESLTHLERLYRQLSQAKEKNDEARIKKLEEQIDMKRHEGESIPDFTAYKPGYFNTGCCCFIDGDVTGIEVADNMIRLVKWKYTNETPARIILEEAPLEKFIDW